MAWFLRQLTQTLSFSNSEGGVGPFLDQNKTFLTLPP